MSKIDRANSYERILQKSDRALRRFDRNQRLLHWARVIGFQLYGLFLLVCAGNQVRELVWWLLS